VRSAARSSPKRFFAAWLCLVVAFLGMSTGAEAKAPFAPVDRRGPPLSVPRANLAKSLLCNKKLGRSAREWILLVPATTLDPAEAYDWNYQPAFKDKRLSYCTVTVPERSTGDIQIAAEYVVFAIRHMHRVTGRKVQMVGWSQGGGPLPRWALRWWPDVRPLVDDLVAIAPTNHGTPLERVFCAAGCPPAPWQQRDNAIFIEALNSRLETFPGISYTVIYSRTDEIVQPSVDGSAASLRGGRNVVNVATQDVCPSDASDHISIMASSVTYALVFDALMRTGPADPRGVDTDCSQPFHPYAGGTDFPGKYGDTWLLIMRENPNVAAEPALKCYVTASCKRSPNR
jgi:hypothetical protein